MNTISTKIAIGYAHSKLILIGEHAVVYGQPAIAIPFPLTVRSVIEQSTGTIKIKSPHYTGPIDKMPIKLEGIEACIKATLDYLDRPVKDILIRLDSTIPLGRGLGSSAAIAIALVRSLFSYYGQSPSQKELSSLVQIAEIYAHGNPSGIDMAAIASDSPIWFQKGKEAKPLTAGAPLYIVVADTGRISDTHSAVEQVREKVLLDPINMQKSMKLIGNIAQEAKNVLSHGNSYLLGKLLDKNQEMLTNLGVTDDGLNRLIETARNTGALGAKLTGSGRGGCMIALAQNLEHGKVIADHLMKSGADKTWYYSTEKYESRIYTRQRSYRIDNTKHK
jgi:mevalonate kinase